MAHEATHVVQQRAPAVGAESTQPAGRRNTRPCGRQPG
jgi:hypothetical protein